MNRKRKNGRRRVPTYGEDFSDDDFHDLYKDLLKYCRGHAMADIRDSNSNFGLKSFDECPERTSAYTRFPLTGVEEIDMKELSEIITEFRDGATVTFTEDHTGKSLWYVQIPIFNNDEDDGQDTFNEGKLRRRTTKKPSKDRLLLLLFFLMVIVVVAALKTKASEWLLFIGK